MCSFERDSDVLFTNFSPFESYFFTHNVFLGDKVSQSCLFMFMLRQFAAQFLDDLYIKQRENEQVPAKKMVVFDRLH